MPGLLPKNWRKSQALKDLSLGSFRSRYTARRRHNQKRTPTLTKQNIVPVNAYGRFLNQLVIGHWWCRKPYSSKPLRFWFWFPSDLCRPISSQFGLCQTVRKPSCWGRQHRPTGNSCEFDDWNRRFDTFGHADNTLYLSQTNHRSVQGLSSDIAINFFDCLPSAMKSNHLLRVMSLFGRRQSEIARPRSMSTHWSDWDMVSLKKAVASSFFYLESFL